MDYNFLNRLFWILNNGCIVNLLLNSIFIHINEFESLKHHIQLIDGIVWLTLIFGLIFKLLSYL